MWTLEEIASNNPLTREENLEWLKDPTKKERPYCSCLRKSEGFETKSNSFFDALIIGNCFTPCKEQREILEAREKIKSNK